MTSFIIKIRKTSFFEPHSSLEDSARLHLVFTSLDFVTILFYKARSSALRPTPNVEDQAPVFMSPSDRVPQLYPQAELIRHGTTLPLPVMVVVPSAVAC
jgi:hypothetical protein